VTIGKTLQKKKKEEGNNETHDALILKGKEGVLKGEKPEGKDFEK